MRIALVVAYARDRVIGKDGKIPWHLPADMKHFRAVTMGKPVVMGRRTFESIGHALPGRRNLVLTREAGFGAEGVEVVRAVEEALARCADAPEVAVIGGANVYAQFLPYATDLHITEVDAAFEGDAYFPRFERSDWEEVARERHEPDAKNRFPYTFLTLRRRAKATSSSR